MDIGDNGEFRNRLVMLAELFDVKLSPQRVALYFEALRDLPFVDVARGLNAAVKGCTFMPKPAEIRRLAVGDDEDQTERAWLALKAAMGAAGAYSSLAIEDPALAETITAMWGDWPRACSEELSPEMWASKRKEFGRIYRVMVNRQLEGGRYLAGICEQQNANRDDWQRFNPVALVTFGEVRRLTAEQAEECKAMLASSRGNFTRLRHAMTLPPMKDETA